MRRPEAMEPGFGRRLRDPQSRHLANETFRNGGKLCAHENKQSDVGRNKKNADKLTTLKNDYTFMKEQYLLEGSFQALNNGHSERGELLSTFLSYKPIK